MIRLALVFALLASPAPAAVFHFCWHGANGFRMAGEIRFPDALLSRDLITEDDVTAFGIIGYRDGLAIGKWSLANLTPTTTWHLRFDPAAQGFLTGGGHLTNSGQAWNANGLVNDCGTPGFGFNSGNNAQDVCVDGLFMIDSSIDRATPLPALPGPLDGSCVQAPLLGKRRLN